jgi:protein phosphatase PTC2/3
MVGAGSVLFLRLIRFLGIWDCLTSQQTVDFVRRQVAEGKELTEICENICDHCLAPDTSSGAGIGCDNMTVMIVALLRGKTKEEWYAWIKDRVEKNHGYATPASPPQLYSASRLMSFRARKEAQERGQRPSVEDNYISPLARVLAQSGGISFLTNGGFVNDSQGSSLMFGETESDEEESGEEEGGEEGVTSSFFSRTLGLGHPDTESADPTKNLKDQLHDFENDEDIDDDGDVYMEEHADGVPKKVQGEAPLPPKPTVNGDKSTSPVPQLQSKPYGDEPLPVVKAEGLLDGSEDPLVKS